MKDLRTVSRCAAALAAVVIPASVSASDAVAPESWKGLSGAELKTAVMESCRPSAYVTAITGPKGMWNVLRQADGTASGYLNRFSSEALPFAPSVGSAPPSAFVFRPVNPGWWESVNPYGNALEQDLYNVFPADGAVSAFVGELIPAEVAVVTSSYGFLSSGIGYFGGGEHRCWQPPAGYEGDVARVVMYMLTVYPECMAAFGATTYSYCDGSLFPSLTPAAARQLMAWHRADPVSPVEQRRNEAFYSSQGNVNPFVEFPEVAEYLWGDKAGEPFLSVSQGEGPQPDLPVQPLRARYSLTDPRIDLVSPWVPSDAVWSVGGRTVEAGFLVPVQLGAGRHMLEFTSPAESGAVVIEIY